MCLHCRRVIGRCAAVPVVARRFCADPQETADADSADSHMSEFREVHASIADRPPAYDGWELMNSCGISVACCVAGRATEAGGHSSSRGNESGAVPFDAPTARFDPPQAGPPARHAPASHRCCKQPETTGRSSAISSLLTWFVFALGITSSACGGALLGWSLATDRQDLWSVGLPVALVGQIALVAGLVLQMDRLWHDNREAAAQLDDVDEQLHELKTTTTLLGANQCPTSAAFYSHLASGAGPQLLLADLKGQLDLLAMKIATESE